MSDFGETAASKTNNQRPAFMTRTVSLNFEKPPLVLPTYIKAITGGGQLSEGETIPRIEAQCRNVAVEISHLENYLKICGFVDNDRLPITYPHVLAFPLQMQLLTNVNFPLKLLGLVHVRNEITQQRRIDARENLDIHTHVDGHRQVHNGVEFDVHTEIYDNQGDRIWHSVSTNLSRGKGSGSKKKKKAASEPLEFGRYASFEAEANIGRRYGLNAGDLNPIHLTPVTAKLFGFKRAIAHGMWVYARAAALMSEEMGKGHTRFSVAFKQPVFLPSSLVLSYGPTKPGSSTIGYSVKRADGQKTHLVGELDRRAAS